MRRRVVSFCAALLFITYSIICGPTYASDIWTVDGNVDPWSDLQELEGNEAPVAVEEASGEEESIFDGLSPDEFFGFSAVLDDGSTIENGVVEGIEMFDSLSQFSASWVTQPATFYMYIQNPGTGANIGNYSGRNSGTSFSVFGSNTYPWQLVYSSQYGSTGYVNYYWYCSESSLTLFVEFTELQGAEIESVTLHGSLTSRLQGFVGSYDLISRNMTSCQLIANVSNSSTPVILSSYVPTSGVARFNSSVIDVNRNVDSVGLRIIYNNIPTSVGSADYGNVPNASGSIGMRLYFAPSSFAGNFEGAKTEGEITNGLLSGLIEIVTGIYNSVVSIPSVLQQIIANIGNILTALTELPGKLWTLISDGLQSLFVPTEEQFQEISSKYDGFFEEKLGFVYQLFSFVVDTFGKLKDTLAAADDYSFHFPGVSFPMNGELIEIIPEQDVSLDNAVMDVLRPVLGTIVTIVCVLALVSLGFDMVVAILSGKSYSQFIGEKREDLDI